MALGLIMPAAGHGRAVRARSAARGAEALEGVAGFVEAPRFYPYLRRARTSNCCAAFDGGGARGRIDAVLESSSWRERAGDRVGGYSQGCASGSGSRRHCCAPAAADPGRAHERARPGRDARHADADQAPGRRRDHRPALRATCSPRSRSCATGSRSSNKGRIVYEGALGRPPTRPPGCVTGCARPRPSAGAGGLYARATRLARGASPSTAMSFWFGADEQDCRRLPLVGSLVWGPDSGSAALSSPRRRTLESPVLSAHRGRCRTASRRLHDDETDDPDRSTGWELRKLALTEAHVTSASAPPRSCRWLFVVVMAFQGKGGSPYDVPLGTATSCHSGVPLAARRS